MKPQTLRVLNVLRQRPVTLADFDCQPACDGGDRITRLGARIQDLKDDGYRLRSSRIGHIARYTLIAEPEEVMSDRPHERPTTGPISVRGRDRQVKSAGNASATTSPGSTLAYPAVRVADTQPACPSHFSSTTLSPVGEPPAPPTPRLARATTSKTAGSARVDAQMSLLDGLAA